MPKIITLAMRAHLDAETTRLAAIWRITRKDGAQFFFTDHDRDIVFGDEVYRADTGFERTAIRSDAGFAVDNLDLVGVFAEGGIVEDEVRAGLFDGAEIAISFVNWEDPDGRSHASSCASSSSLHPACMASWLSAIRYARFCASLRCSKRITGTSASPSLRAASSRPWPARIPAFSSIRIGLVHPNSTIEAAI